MIIYSRSFWSFLDIFYIFFVVIVVSFIMVCMVKYVVGYVVRLVIIENLKNGVYFRLIDILGLRCKS